MAHGSTGIALAGSSGLACGKLWMQAVLVVSGNPYYTVTDAHGGFKLTDVPPGKYILKLWHETLGEQTKDVMVNPNAEVTVAFGFKGS
jgi:hypothetical protein